MATPFLTRSSLVALVLIGVLTAAPPVDADEPTAAPEGLLLNRDAAAVAAGAQLTDRRPAPTEPFHWGITAGMTPHWWTPTAWRQLFFQGEAIGLPSSARAGGDAVMTGRDLRIGIVRGRPRGFEFGFSYVRKTVNRDLRVTRNGAIVSSGDTPAVVTYRGLTDVDVPGIDGHLLIPVARIGKRVMLGALVGLGYGFIPDALVEERIDGPSFYGIGCNINTASSIPPASGAAVLDDRGNCVALPRGATGVTFNAPFSAVTPRDKFFLLARGQLTADVLLASSLKVRVSGGFNHPGAQLFGIDVVYLFGTH